MIRHLRMGLLQCLALVGLAAPAPALTFELETTMQIELASPTGSLENVILTGTTVWGVPFEGPSDGDALDDDGNGLDDLDTTMQSMDLVGASADIGPLQLRIDDRSPAPGVLEERVDNTPGTLDIVPFSSFPVAADSVFALLFEIVVSSTGDTLRTDMPIRFSAILSDLPGLNEVYAAPFQTEPLFDESGVPTGLALGPGEFVFTSVVPEPSTGMLMLFGLAGLSARRWGGAAAR